VRSSAALAIDQISVSSVRWHVPNNPIHIKKRDRCVVGLVTDEAKELHVLSVQIDKGIFQNPTRSQMMERKERK
jgi:hypothetical protein